MVIKGDGSVSPPTRDTGKDRRSSDGGMGLLRRLELLSKRSHEAAHGSHEPATNRRGSTLLPRRGSPQRSSPQNRERRSSNHRCASS